MPLGVFSSKNISSVLSGGPFPGSFLHPPCQNIEEMRWDACVQSCSTLCEPVDCSLPGSSVHGILQASTLEWVALLSSKGIYLTQGSNMLSLTSPASAGGFFTTSTTLEVQTTTTSLRKTVLRMSGVGQVVISYHCWGVAKQTLQNRKGETFISLPAKENKTLVPWIRGTEARGGVIRCMFVF